MKFAEVTSLHTTARCAMRWTLPGFRYLGPNNSLPTDNAVLPADFIALQHDWAYSRATSRWQICWADLRTAVLFLWNSVCAALACVCLLFKFVCELVLLTTFYPWHMFSFESMLHTLLLIVCLLWISLLELRLLNFTHHWPANACVRESSWATVECLLHELQQKA